MVNIYRSHDGYIHEFIYPRVLIGPSPLRPGSDQPGGPWSDMIIWYEIMSQTIINWSVGLLGRIVIDKLFVFFFQRERGESEPTVLVRRREMTIDDERSIYVGGFAYDCTEEDLRDIFEIYGSVVAVKVIFL